MSALGPTSHIDATRFLEARATPGELDVALVILNSPIADYEYLRRLYSHASFCVCADGGANRLHDILTQQFPHQSRDDALRTALPHLIHGDLDSIEDSVRQCYEHLGVEITQHGDKYSTDFEKSVQIVLHRVPDVRDVLVSGSLGGRVDQGIGLLGELYREYKLRHPGTRFWLFSEASVSIILGPGATTISTPVGTGLITRNIGILPIYGPAIISLKGLEWDVQDWPTEMGGQVSTSNHIVADQITITTDREVLFTVERAILR